MSLEKFFDLIWDFSQSKSEEDYKKIGFTPEIRSLSFESQVIVILQLYTVLKDVNSDEAGEELHKLTGLKKEFINDLISDIETSNLALSALDSKESFLKDNHKLYTFARNFSSSKLYGIKKKVPQVDLNRIKHPQDKQGLDELKSVTGLDAIITMFNDIYDDKVIKLENQSKLIHVTPKQYPDLYYLMKEVAQVLGLEKEPDLYLRMGYFGAYTTSINDPCIVLDSGLLNVCTRDELMFIIGHEIGHIMSKHLLYTQVSVALPELLKMTGKFTFGVTSLLGAGLELKFATWSRSSEYTADRFGLLACQNIGAAITSILKMSGAPPNFITQVDFEEFLNQIENYNNVGGTGPFAKIVKYVAKIDESHPYNVFRLRQIIDYANDNKEEIAA